MYLTHGAPHEMHTFGPLFLREETQVEGQGNDHSRLRRAPLTFAVLLACVLMCVVSFLSG